MAVLRRVSDETPRSIKELNPEIPDWLAAIVDKLHAKDPADRYQNAREVAELLNQHLAQLQQASWTPVPGGLAEGAPLPTSGPDGLITSLTICPSCGGHLHVPDKMVGSIVSCPQCGKPFQVEDTSQEIQVIQLGKPQVVSPAKRKWRTRRWAWLAGGVALFFLLGCGFLGLFMVRWVHSNRAAPATMAVSHWTGPLSPAKAKLDAARAISNLGQRDAVLTKIAEEAAAGGDAPVVREALQTMSNNSARDETAATCALGLARAGKNREATEVAKRINNLSQRDAILSKLATGELDRREK